MATTLITTELPQIVSEDAYLYCCSSTVVSSIVSDCISRCITRQTGLSPDKPVLQVNQ